MYSLALHFRKEYKFSKYEILVLILTELENAFYNKLTTDSSDGRSLSSKISID